MFLLGILFGFSIWAAIDGSYYLPMLISNIKIGHPNEQVDIPIKTDNNNELVEIKKVNPPKLNPNVFVR